MLRKLSLYPPLAFARLGNSSHPLDAFNWGPSDNSPRGTARTTIEPAPTLRMRADGTLEEFTPTSVCFKDDEGIRPVCPFFEIRVRTGVRRVESLTPALLGKLRRAVGDVRWRVEVANLKAFFMTGKEGTRVEARVDLRGDDVRPHTLQGRAPRRTGTPLVPRGRHIPLGTVRLSKPTAEFPGLRLRFLPARGCVYGPKNLLERWKVDLRGEFLFLDPRSSWCSWKPDDTDPRGWPDGQFAKDEDGVSYGIVDDTCDGIVSCWIEGVDLPPARARIVVGPPDYAPDRRPLVSLADGLKDRVDREEIFRRNYVDGTPASARRTEQEVVDLMERAFETMALINLDVFNDRVTVQENAAVALGQGIAYDEKTAQYAFPVNRPMPGDPLPLTEQGREHHRRHVAAEVLTDFLRKRPDFVTRFVRPPLSPDAFFDTLMPALMRGASGHPLHLTRRQYDLLTLWARSLRRSE
jgi:hypothetical protein